jgi:hypothetical protein
VTRLLTVLGIVSEMAVPVGAHPEFPPEAVENAVRWVKDGGTVTPIEGSKFHILRRDRTYALGRSSDGEILGWVIFGEKVEKFGRIVNPIINIHILPKYRGTIAALMLITGTRGSLTGPVWVDGVVFTGGVELLRGLGKRPNLLRVTTVHKKTGETAEYKPDDITLDDLTAILIEQINLPTRGEVLLPGGGIGVVYSLFEEFHPELLSTE